ncbi:nucleotidyltransferase family protein [Thermosipho ferrireducens]|uniref:Nucleotidyltransferase family protein n=1 Tax=Thermosipho ferrireducens TaxID=2571116 RepID=A0ABX7S6K4_9BACT|nr:nucleotidyltransferase family protein [Thermosipho ferrireducens]QTA38214.1 nucleotidyltransferase family protein [Thermosipho ferrireducens]
MKNLKEIKDVLEKHREDIREKYGVIILGIFGSFVRGEQSEESDIDILIEIEKPIGLKFFELWDELEKLLGCKVDLVRKKLLRKEIRNDILKEVIEI